METLCKPGALIDNPSFARQRDDSLAELDLRTIDAPIENLVRAFARIPFCFTLQSCFGHFLPEGEEEERRLEPLEPRPSDTKPVVYRIAYVALCIEAGERGRALIRRLEKLTGLDPDYVQFGSAGWFLERQVNAFVLQVEPERFKHLDRCTLDYREALHVQRTRDRFYAGLESVIRDSPGGP
jgi:hypothetical protein